MWDLDYKGNWVSNNWYFQIVVLEKTPKSPLDCKEIKPVNSKGNQSGIFIRKTDAEAPVPILWLPDAKSWLIKKDPDTGKIKSKRSGDSKVQDFGIASSVQWTWVWASSGRWWRIGKPAVLQSMGLQRVGHD